MDHLTPSQDRFRMRLDAATLTGPSLAAGAAPAGRSRKSGRLLCFRRPEGEDRRLPSRCLSLYLSVYMTSGPNGTAGPACQFEWWLRMGTESGAPSKN
jgi:hypothetical protein